MKKLFVLAALPTICTLMAQAQTAPDTTTTTTESTTSRDDRMAVPARTENGKTMIVPADGAKIKSMGKKIKVK